MLKMPCTQKNTLKSLKTQGQSRYLAVRTRWSSGPQRQVRGCRSSSSSVRAARAVTRTRLISKMACRSRPRARRGSPVLSRKMGMSGIARANMPGPHLTSDLSTRKPNGLLSGSELLRTRSRAPVISLPFSPAWNRAPPRQRRRAPLEVASRRARRKRGWCGSVDVRMWWLGLKQPCARATWWLAVCFRKLSDGPGGGGRRRRRTVWPGDAVAAG